MRAHQIVFTQPNEVELQEFDFDPTDLADDEVAVKNHYSLISPGTELACLRGIEDWARLPFVPGYAGCGEVIAVGKKVRRFQPGDTIFAYTRHASHVKARALSAPVPAGIDERQACYARMAAVAITALQVSNAALGDYVAVLGLGLVGNLAAQLFTLAGCEVIGVDLAPRRLEIARRCGIAHTLNPADGDLAERVAALTNGAKCATVVEATGAPAVALEAGKLAGKLGEVILLGTPRGAYHADVTEFLRGIHLWSSGCITFKGAHEWRAPIEPGPDGAYKHSIQRNIEILLRLIARGRLHVADLITHVLPPQECARAYAGLRDDPDAYMGVVFDWQELN
jgi:2-desacetyl-2-hydroxyethyl bacteriochlorophyllide A dehydrogenase